MEIDDLAHDLGYGPDEYEVADTEYVRGGDLIVHFKEAE